jgi:hypothetical protein
VNGYEYRQLIGRYLVSTYGPRGVDVYEEIALGTSTLGKTRRIDLLVLERPTGRALALECKYQDSAGTADEKIPYALDELRALRVPGAIVYAGSGFSDGVLHLLQSSPLAAYCLPDVSLQPLVRARGGEWIHRGTWQLDHVVAQTFGYWEVIIGEKKPLRIAPIDPAIGAAAAVAQPTSAPRPNAQNVPSSVIEPGAIATPIDD